MKNAPPPTTEYLIIVACLAIAGAVLTIAREVLVPLVALVLYLAGWRPRPAAPDRLPWVQYAGRLQRTDADCVVTDHVNTVADLATARARRDQEAGDLGYMLAVRPTTITPMEPLQHVPYPTLQRMARAAGLPATGTAQQLRERLTRQAADEAAIDRLNDVGPESLSAEQRNAGGLL